MMTRSQARTSARVDHTAEVQGQSLNPSAGALATGGLTSHPLPPSGVAPGVTVAATGIPTATPLPGVTTRNGAPGLAPTTQGVYEITRETLLGLVEDASMRAPRRAGEEFVRVNNAQMPEHPAGSQSNGRHNRAPGDARPASRIAPSAPRPRSIIVASHGQDHSPHNGPIRGGPRGQASGQRRRTPLRERAARSPNDAASRNTEPSLHSRGGIQDYPGDNADSCGGRIRLRL